MFNKLFKKEHFVVLCEYEDRMQIKNIPKSG